MVLIEDTFLKEGLLIVGIVILVILMVFVIKAQKSMQQIPEEHRQTVEGSNNLKLKITSLCDICKEERNQDTACFIIDANTEESIETQGLLIPAGKNTIILRNKQNNCIVEIP